MDTDQLIAHSRARFAHESAKRILKEKYQAKMIFAHAGGMWQAGPELMVLTHACMYSDEIVLMDLYNTPIKVDPTELLKLCRERWQEQTNAWLIEHQEINKKR